MKFADFTSLMQVCHHIISINEIHTLLTLKQLASSLLTTCSRLVLVKPKQAMRTDPDICTMTTRRNLRVSGCVCEPVYSNRLTITPQIVGWLVGCNWLDGWMVGWLVS